MLVKVKNSPPLLESLFLSVVVVGTFMGAAFYGLNIAGYNHAAASTAILVGLAASFFALILVNKRNQADGNAVIDTEKEMIYINGSEGQPFTELTFYTSSLISPPFSRLNSRMKITLGYSENLNFSLTDNRTTFTGYKGANHAELEVLENMVTESSLTHQQKDSFAIWADRSRIFQS